MGKNMDDLFEQPSRKDRKNSRQPHLYRKLFLLVFAIALLWQGLIFVDVRLNSYYQELRDSFKVILTIPSAGNNEQLSQLGDSLNQKTDIQTVQLFSPQDALEIIRRQNPQLAESLLLMGKERMPAYFELTLSPQAINNIRPFVDNLAAEYDNLVPHYNEEHARLVFYTGICSKVLHLVFVLALLVFLTFMFLVEATPVSVAHSWGGALSGMLAPLLAWVVFAGLLYPTGFLAQAVSHFTSWGRELLLLVFCGLLGWTLSKWQKF